MQSNSIEELKLLRNNYKSYKKEKKVPTVDGESLGYSNSFVTRTVNSKLCTVLSWTVLYLLPIFLHYLHFMRKNLCAPLRMIRLLNYNMKRQWMNEIFEMEARRLIHLFLLRFSGMVYCVMIF